MFHQFHPPCNKEIPENNTQSFYPVIEHHHHRKRAMGASLFNEMSLVNFRIRETGKVI